MGYTLSIKHYYVCTIYVPYYCSVSFGSSLCFNCWDQFSLARRVFSRLVTLNNFLGTFLILPCSKQEKICGNHMLPSTSMRHRRLLIHIIHFDTCMTLQRDQGWGKRLSNRDPFFKERLQNGRLLQQTELMHSNYQKAWGKKSTYFFFHSKKHTTLLVFQLVIVLRPHFLQKKKE